MTQLLEIEIPESGKQKALRMKLTYRRGKFRKLELTGGITEAYLRRIGHIIPPTWEAVEPYSLEYKGKCSYTEIVKERSLYQRYVDAWHEFYERFMQIPPKFTGADGIHIKQIIRYLSQLEGSEEKGLALWGVVLASWDKLDDFHRNNTDLKYLNSRLNVILNNVKRVNADTGQYENDFK